MQRSGSGEGGGAEAGVPLTDLEDYLKALANEKRLRLLRYLQIPHYLEEMASELGVARQTARGHLDKLLDIGVVEPVHDAPKEGAVREYVVVPQRIFYVLETLRDLGNLNPEAGEETALAHRTDELSDEAKPGEEAPVPRLTVVHGMRLRETVFLQGDGPWQVGRDPHAHLCLDYDPFVSQQHAEVRRTPAGGFELADLYSSNGTFLEGDRLERGAQARLDPGSLLRVGKTLVLFRAP